LISTGKSCLLAADASAAVATLAEPGAGIKEVNLSASKVGVPVPLWHINDPKVLSAISKVA